MKYIDMIAKLGLGNAHPGGFTATLKQLQCYPLQPNDRILEVGCGTGRTACHLAMQGFDVTAVDLHPDMLAKAKRRATSMRVHVDFAQGDACALPFPDNTFDVVLIESVTNFADVQLALREYYRVLRPGGHLYDRELAMTQYSTENPPADTLGVELAYPSVDLPADLSEVRRLQQVYELTDFLGLRQLMTPSMWDEQLRRCGFNTYQLLEIAPYIENSAQERNYVADPYEFIDAGLFENPELWRVASEYAELMDLHRENLLYILIHAIK
jgi:SAM-dependent methyltransferase